MARTIPGLHHVTAIAGDPQRNVDFYAGVLGLRLIKRTVNFDDPGTYHLYFGNEQGAPGTVMTFFPWGDSAPRGRIGDGQVTATAFSVPAESLDYWKDRLKAHRVPHDVDPDRFGDTVLRLQDPDGLHVELVGTEETDDRAPWPHVVPEAHAIRGFHHVTLNEEGYERTSDLLKNHLGFRDGPSEGGRHRFITGDGGASAMLDVVCTPEIARGQVARGTVHHIAWRTPDTREQTEWRDRLAAGGYDVTPVIDRNYFMSIYFREPGGVLFEIATDPPGFTADESLDNLGTKLMLPPQYEGAREQLESMLPPIRAPEQVAP